MNAQSGFTFAQASGANQVILDLMKKHRFFLSKEHSLDSSIFSDPINLDKTLREVYKSQAATATKLIKKGEGALCITPPVLKDGQSITTCSLYTGGLEICDAYPIQSFLDFVPETPMDFYGEIFKMCHGEVSDIKPRELGDKIDSATYITRRLWEELQEIENKKDGIVVVMETKFEADKYGFDLLGEKVEDLIFSAYGLAYLFYKKESINRTIKHSYVLFDTNETNHLRVTHSDNGEGPVLTFGNSGVYGCKVKFVCLR